MECLTLVKHPKGDTTKRGTRYRPCVGWLELRIMTSTLNSTEEIHEGLVSSLCWVTWIGT